MKTLSIFLSIILGISICGCASTPPGISGKITNTTTGKPLPELAVELQRCQDGSCNYVNGVLTDQKGRYLLNDLEPGNYMLTIIWETTVNCGITQGTALDSIQRVNDFLVIHGKRGASGKTTLIASMQNIQYAQGQKLVFDLPVECEGSKNVDNPTVPLDQRIYQLGKIAQAASPTPTSAIARFLMNPTEVAGTQIARSTQEAVVTRVPEVFPTKDLSGLPASTGGIMPRLIDWPVFQLAFSPGGQSLAGSGMGGSITVWDTLTQQALAELDPAVPGKPVSSLAYSPDGSLLVSTNSPTINLWETSTFSFKKSINVADAYQVKKLELGRVVFIPPGKTILVEVLLGVPGIFDLETGQLLGRLVNPEGGAVNFRSIAVSPDGNLAATAGTGSSIVLWDLQKFERLALLAPGEGFYSQVLFSPDGKKLVAVTGGNRKLQVWDVQSRNLLETKETGLEEMETSMAALSPDGRYLALVQSKTDNAGYRTMVVLQTDSMQEKGHFYFPSDQYVNEIIWGQDGKWFAATDGVYLCIWDLSGLTGAE
jgi:hypothetical protein